MQAKGYGIIVDPSTPTTKEIDTFTCAHCNAVVVCRSSSKDIPVDLGGFCRLCYEHVCGKCADRGRCDPFEKKLERAEQQGRFRRALEGGSRK